MQLTLSGKRIDEIAIERLKTFEPPEGYYLAFSGGKDSIVILDIAKRAKVKFDAHYNYTTVDPPEVFYFVKSFPEVEIHHPAQTMWQLIVKKMPPLRHRRWCCEKLKEGGGSGRTVITGVRRAESTRRSKRKMVESCYKDNTKKYVNPIIDWEDADVWEYIKSRNLRYCSLYDEGFKRIGCVLCPMTRDVEKEILRWPKIAKGWERAVYKHWEKHANSSFESPEAYWRWWLDRDASRKNSDENVLFE